MLKNKIQNIPRNISQPSPVSNNGSYLRLKTFTFTSPYRHLVIPAVNQKVFSVRSQTVE
jgi:hypothetical protein